MHELHLTGLKRSDPRFRQVVENLHSMSRELGGTSIDKLALNAAQFERVISDHVLIITQALQDHFVIPEFSEFCKYIEEFYWKCKANTKGQVAQYIPQLSKVNPGIYSSPFSFGNLFYHSSLICRILGY